MRPVKFLYSQLLRPSRTGASRFRVGALLLLVTFLGEARKVTSRRAAPGEFDLGRLIKNIYLTIGATALLTAFTANAQPYPSKPIRILTSAPGNSDDLAARLIAVGVTSGLGQQAIVDNRGVVAVEIAAKSPPDGYTLLLYGSPMWLAPFMRDNLPYDPVKDFTPVTWATSSPNLLVVHPSLPVRSVRELIALARARPDELNYGSGSAGSTPHLAGELFRAMAGVRIVRVAYKGSGPALTALLGGEVQFMFPSTGSANALLKSGKLRPLAVTALKPTALAPGLPTVSESGLPGYESASLLAVFAPAGTPNAIVQRLNQEMAKALQRADARERLFNAGVEAVGSTPEQFAATLKAEMGKWGKVIRDAGIRSE